MKLIKPFYNILTPINGEEIIETIELAARTCYQSEGKIEQKEYQIFPRNFTAISGRKLVSKLIDRKHDAMLEFGQSITVKFICDRGVSHELVRHRLASFAQESTRYCNYGNDEHIQFIIPCWIELKEGIYKLENPDDYTQFSDQNGEYAWFISLTYAEQMYNKMLQQKCTPQQARSVLPNSLKTSINIKANIREWRHIFKMRTAKVAHPQMRELMCPLLDEFKEKIPLLFDDITYEK